LSFPSGLRDAKAELSCDYQGLRVSTGAGSTLAVVGLMTLFRSSRCLSAMQPLALVAAFATTGCGDDFVAFSEAPPLSAGSAAVENPSGSASGGAAAQHTGGAVSAAVPVGAGTGATVSVVLSTAGTGSVADEGGTSAAGQPGAAGEPDAGEPSALPTEAFELIDDVEGPFPSLPARDGRNGGWYTVHDGSNGEVTAPSATALQPVRGSSHFAAGVSGAGFTDWGAQLGVSLMSPAAGYDASRYCGIRFLVKGSGAGWSLLVSDGSSVPQGGVCVEGSLDPEQGCYNFVGKSFGVSGEWQEVKVRFDELRLLEHPGSARRLDASALYDIVFNFYAAEGSAFQLLVDDLSFIEKTPTGCQ
jgi:hypothetical protein